jgi:hypothetical protein
MKRLSVIILVLLALNPTFSQEKWHNEKLKISENGHYLSYENGKPFFWLGDTAWEMFHRLKLEEIETYLENRKQKGFNVIQAVVLAEMDGLRKPNRYGQVPFENLDPTKPNEKYFELIDSAIKLAESKGLYIGLLPTWGDKTTLLWGEGPVIFNKENAYGYGLWIAKRYKDNPNIIWILGGDRPPMKDSDDWTPIWRAMAKGIIDGSNNKSLITYHPWGGDLSTSQYIHNEPWLDINMMQSGHGGGHDVPVWKLVQRDFDLKPTKPTLDSEPNYEDHPVNPWPTWDPKNGYYRDYDVRKQCYRSVFSGACGVTYGHHSVWQFYSEKEKEINFPDRYWNEAMDRPGAFQVGYLRKLIESRPQLERIPDQSLILNGQGEKGEYSCAFRDQIGSYEMIYIPFGKTIKVNTSHIKSKKINLTWFNPRTCKSTATKSIANSLEIDFTPPTLGLHNDWVLIIDNPKFNYKNPK